MRPANIDYPFARAASRTLFALSVTAMLQSPIPRTASAQGEVSGRVVAADSGRLPVQAAEAAIAKLGRRVLSDSSGRFRLKEIPPGAHTVVLRAIGFKSESSLVTIEFDEVVSWNVTLTRTTGTALPERVVSAAAPAPAKLAEFMERRETGAGNFITREQLAKAEGGRRQTGDVISQVPGVRIRRGGTKIWVASARTTKSVRCAFCVDTIDDTANSALNAADFAAGARPACYMDVYIDGVRVYDSRHPELGLFDVNTLSPEHIAGIEVYSSAAQVPAKYDRSGPGCGVLLIWTR